MKKEKMIDVLKFRNAVVDYFNKQPKIVEKNDIEVIKFLFGEENEIWNPEIEKKFNDALDEIEEKTIDTFFIKQTDANEIIKKYEIEF